jgi:hypothetical protein
MIPLVALADFTGSPVHVHRSADRRTRPPTRWQNNKLRVNLALYPTPHPQALLKADVEHQWPQTAETSPGPPRQITFMTIYLLS